jgi:hypothetical protein
MSCNVPYTTYKTLQKILIWKYQLKRPKQWIFKENIPFVAKFVYTTKLLSKSTVLNVLGFMSHMKMKKDAAGKITKFGSN